MASIDDSMQLSDIDDSDDNLETISEAGSTTDTDDSRDSEDAAILDNLCKIPVYPNRLCYVSHM